MSCEKIYMVLVSFFGFILSLIGLVLFIMSVILCQICVIQHLAYNDKPWVEKNLSQHSKELEKY